MKYSVVVLTAFGLLACQPKLDGQHILEKSIAFHDPQNQWSSFTNEIHLKSDFVYPDTANYQLTIGLNNRNHLVSYTNLTLGERIDFTATDCEVIVGTKACEEALWVKNFYHFILGLPMTLQFDKQRIEKAVVKTNFKGKTAFRIAVNYENEKWHFYFSEANYELLGYAFNKNKVAKAEEITTEGLFEIDKMKLIKSRSWWITTDTLNPVYSGKDEIVVKEL
jgi:hypothetical protein